MAPSRSTAPVAGIAGPHQNTVATILRAVEMGVFTTAQAELLIDRVRLIASPIEFPSPAADDPPQPAGITDRPDS